MKKKSKIKAAINEIKKKIICEEYIAVDRSYRLRGIDLSDDRLEEIVTLETEFYLFFDGYCNEITEDTEFRYRDLEKHFKVAKSLNRDDNEAVYAYLEEHLRLSKLFNKYYDLYLTRILELTDENWIIFENEIIKKMTETICMLMDEEMDMKYVYKVLESKYNSRDVVSD